MDGGVFITIGGEGQRLGEKKRTVRGVELKRQRTLYS
jgi:hypothetical protein